MRVVRLVAALSLTAGMALTAGRVMAQSSNDRLDDDFFLVDTRCDESSDPNDQNGAIIRIGGNNGSDSFEVEAGVSGTGTAGDLVVIEYGTALPNQVSADDKSGKVSQKSWSFLCVTIDCDDCARDTGGDECVSVEKCKVDGSVKLDTKTNECSGDAGASCSGTDLYSFLTQDQVTSIQAAFPKGNKCGVKIDVNDPGKKSSFKVNLKAKKNTDSCRFGAK